jgi:hypothetical protein
MSIHSPRRVRGRRDPFGISEHAEAGSRQSQGAYVIAKRLSRVFGECAPVVERYWQALASASQQDLLRLRRAGIEIVFAPTIASALRTDWAVRRRGRELTAQELGALEESYGPDSKAAAAYFSDVRALLLPTATRAADLEHVVLHEVGHALTFDAASARTSERPELLDDLPAHLRRHVAHYRQGTEPEAVAERVLEALAESYVLLTVGRETEIPHGLLSELLGIMSEMDSPHPSPNRSGVDRKQARSATYLDQHQLIDRSDQRDGHELAALPAPGQELRESYIGDCTQGTPCPGERRRAAS